MTNYEFACADLTQAIIKPLRKKFKYLTYGDKVYEILIWLQSNIQPTYCIYEYKFKNKLMENNDITNNKRRKALFYLTEEPPYVGFKGDINKSGSIVTNIYTKKQIQIRIFATTKEECIERANKIMPKEKFIDKLKYIMIT